MNLSTYHQFIPFGVRVNLINLFHHHQNRIVMCNVELLYFIMYEQGLNISRYGCYNLNQLFNNMPNLFYLSKNRDAVFVNCSIKKDSFHYSKIDEFVEVRLNSLNNLSMFFEYDDFLSFEKSLLQTMILPSSIKDLEMALIKSNKPFSIMKYGFESVTEFFITFSDLFDFKPLQTTEQIEKETIDFKSIQNFLLNIKTTKLTDLVCDIEDNVDLFC